MVSIGVKGSLQAQTVCLSCPARPRMLCSGMPDALLSTLSGISTRVRVERGDSLFHEGDDARYVYNVVDGFLRLSRLSIDGRRQVMGFLTTGDYIGHTNKLEYSESAEALTEGEVCRFERDELMALLAEYPAFERQFQHMTAGLLDDMLDLVFTLGKKNALERVASFLTHSLDRASHHDVVVKEIWLPMTRADIADFLGLTLETVSRSMSRLKKMGVIEIEHAHRVVVLDRARLIDLSLS